MDPEHLHIHVHLDGLLGELRQAITQGFQQLTTALIHGDDTMSQHMDALIQQVASIKDVAQSAATTLRGIRQQLEEAGSDPAKLQALRESLASSEMELSEAIANDPDSTP